MIRWVFFDLGWTLVDETQPCRKRWELARTMPCLARLNLTVDDLMRISGEVSCELGIRPLHAVFDRLQLTPEERQTLAPTLRYDNDHEELYPGVPELLAELQHNYALGIIANQSPGAEARLKAWGIRNHFSLVFASAEVGLSKPDPRLFDLALRQAGCPPQEAVLVGDRVDNDIIPARKLGWNTVRVLQGFHRLQKPRGPHEEPHVTVENLQQVPAALAELNRRSPQHLRDGSASSPGSLPG